MNLRNFILILICLMYHFVGMAQTYDDHLGEGNTIGVTTSSSTDDAVNVEINSINGTGYLPDEAAAVRFFQQAGFGYNYADVQALTTQGIENWIDEQITLQGGSLQAEAIAKSEHFNLGSSPINDGNYINQPWFNKVFTDEDQLRMKTAYALSQILVVSSGGGSGIPIRSYFDYLYLNAFGNFRDILHDVTMHLFMGRYLSFDGNERQNLVAGSFPDENYAREVMQLFTIGLNELNNDGTLKLDEHGNNIPTYDIDDIAQLAKVFTGLSGGTYPDFVMEVNESKHDKSPKKLIDGTILPANQSTMEDVDDALDMLFNHPNTGPFISIRLIQQFVKSNPTPAYVNRVATTFNNNGEGVRGDMGAVIKAILLDPEARDCKWIEHETAGKLLQYPELFFILLKALNVSTPSGLYYFNETDVWGGNQRFMRAPSVFNFFSPFYAEPTTVEQAGMVSPEFQNFSGNESIIYFNNLRGTLKGRPFPNRTNVSGNASYDLSFEENLYNTQGVAALVDHYNLLLCRNQMPESTQLTIENAITQFENNVDNYDSFDAVTDVVLFITSSAYFAVLN